MIVEVISSLPIALAIDVAIVSVIFCAIACVIHCLCVIVWLIENKYRVRSPLLEQLYWTMCYTSLAQLKRKQRQRHLSEHIQFLRRAIAVFKSSSLKPGDSTSWTDGEGRETTTWVSQRLQNFLKNHLRNLFSCYLAFDLAEPRVCVYLQEDPMLHGVMLEILNLRATFKRALHFLENLQMLTSANILGDLWKMIFAEFLFHEISWKYIKWMRIFRQLMERLQNMRNNAAGDGETNCRFSSQPNTKSYSV